MTLYHYKAKDKEGNLYERTVEASQRLDLYGVIREEGGTVISIKEAKPYLEKISFGSLFSAINTHQKITFAKNLGMMLKAGLPVTRALAVMTRQMKSKILKKLLTDIEAEVSRGKTLSETLAKWPKVFSPLFISMVRAGEESGGVSESLAIVANQMEKSYLLLKKVRGALIYPAVIITVMIILAILLLIFMVPTLTATFEGIGATLPLSTRIIIYLSNFLIEHTVIVLTALLSAAFIGTTFLRSKMGRDFVDVAVLKLPVIGQMIREYQSAQTTRTLSSLMSSGVEIVVSLDVTLDVVQNHLYKDVLKKVRTAVEKGEPMSAVFTANENLYPVFVGEMVAVGEETGKIAEMLKGVAQFYEDEVDQKTKNLSTIIEPVLMIIIGIGVGIFAVSMLAPTYSLVDYI